MRDYVDARIEQVTAESNTHFAELRAEIEKLNERIAGVPKLWQLVVTIVGAAAGTLTIMLGVISFAGDRFDAGMGLSANNVENERRLAEVTSRIAAGTQANERKFSEFEAKMVANTEATERKLSEIAAQNERRFSEFATQNERTFSEFEAKMVANTEATERKLSEFAAQMNANWEKMDARLMKVDALLPALEAIVSRSNPGPAQPLVAPPSVQAPR